MADATTQLRLAALAKRVRALRDDRRLTQDEFARRAGISVSFASLLERGERSPSYETLFVIAEALEVPVAELFREGLNAEADDPLHTRLLDFARKARLNRGQVEKLIGVGRVMFGVQDDGEEPLGGCSVEGCGRPVLARGLCGPHYHRERRRALADRA